jgi:protein-disulfide isomerase
MNEQIRKAIQTRLDQGQTYDQIQQDFLTSGYSKEEFDQYFNQVAVSTTAAIPVKVKTTFWSILLPILGAVIFTSLSAGVFFYYFQTVEENVEATTNQGGSESKIATSSDGAIKEITNAGAVSDTERNEVIESEAIEIATKFTNDSNEGIIGLYEAYVDGVKFIEASSTPALIAAKNCLLNIYQNPSYSFTCYIDGIEGVSATSKVSQRSKYLFLEGPDIEHNMFYISETQIPGATDITYGREGTEVHSTLVVPEEFRDEVLDLLSEPQIKTRHDGRHFLGGHPTEEPKAHLVAYIDLDDPFSKRYYTTILELRELYTTQELAIEVQHLPLPQLHPNANKLANASHCAAEQGDEYYWLFIEGVFDGRDGNSAYEMSKLPQLVQNIGLDTAEFNECVEADAYMSIVVKHKQNIITTGAMGTPHTIVFNRITGASEPKIIQGARPLPELTAVIDSIISS